MIAGPDATHAGPEVGTPVEVSAATSSRAKVGDARGQCIGRAAGTGRLLTRGAAHFRPSSQSSISRSGRGEWTILPPGRRSRQPSSVWQTADTAPAARPCSRPSTSRTRTYRPTRVPSGTCRSTSDLISRSLYVPTISAKAGRRPVASEQARGASIRCEAGWSSSFGNAGWDAACRAPDPPEQGGDESAGTPCPHAKRIVSPHVV